MNDPGKREYWPYTIVGCGYDPVKYRWYHLLNGTEGPAMDSYQNAVASLPVVVVE